MNSPAKPLLSLRSLKSVFGLKPAPPDALEYFLTLVKNRRFDAVLTVLLNDPKETKRLIRKYYSNVEPPSVPEPFLHLILQSQPPVELVAIIVSALNEYMGPDVTVEESVNSKQETPLHVACYHHCSSEVIEELLDGRSGMVPAVCRDENGRYPLHLLFLGSRRSSLYNHLEIVNLLLECESDNAHHQDFFGRTALDYAREKRINDQVIDLLLEARVHHDDEDEQPTDALEPGQHATQVPSEFEFDPTAPDEISLLDMKDTRAAMSLDLEGWSDTGWSNESPAPLGEGGEKQSEDASDDKWDVTGWSGELDPEEGDPEQKDVAKAA